MLAVFPALLLALHPGHHDDTAGPQWNCDEPQAQQEMNYCAAQDFKRADEALNLQWAETSAAMKARDERRETGALPELDDRPGYFQTLLEAQRAWIAFRDAHCRSEGYYARGGSLEPLLVSTCKTTLTEARTQQLAQLIEP